MQQQRKLRNTATGMYGSVKTSQGQYDDSNLSEYSGGAPLGEPTPVVDFATRGEPSEAKTAWNLWPYAVAGKAELDPRTLQPGSNLSAVQLGAEAVAKKAGLDEVPTGSSVGGTAAY